MREKFKDLPEDYVIRRLELTDTEIVQNFCERCYDYFQIVKGRAPKEDDGDEILNELPPGKDTASKRVFGSFNASGSLIGLVEMVRDYPEVGEWIIGLLMVDPQVRRNGLGRILHQYVKDYAWLNQAEKLRIGVVEDNQCAYQFWCSLGYAETKKVEMKLGNKVNQVRVMNLAIA